jgi:hypothetical protein
VRLGGDSALSWTLVPFFLLVWRQLQQSESCLQCLRSRLSQIWNVCHVVLRAGTRARVTCRFSLPAGSELFFTSPSIAVLTCVCLTVYCGAVGGQSQPHVFMVLSLHVRVWLAMSTQQCVCTYMHRRQVVAMAIARQDV